MVQVEREMYDDEYVNGDEWACMGGVGPVRSPQVMIPVEVLPQPTAPTERQGRCPACHHETTLIPGIRTWYCKSCCDLEREALRHF